MISQPALPTVAVQEMEADPHVKEGHAGAVTLRAFRNAAGSLRGDLSSGCDSWAVEQGWVAVTPICLRSGGWVGGRPAGWLAWWYLGLGAAGRCGADLPVGGNPVPA